ncbi:MAG TPA: TIGR03643 family protein [Bacteroidia bacterium]|jgi:uncharacterized protein (TIGR03643 family)|nr:TIGR03643 family protein [Bacteroidia bacterium]HQF29666.1 TIGR03643 family protein [Bacteroidia bacterium]
MKLQIKLSEEAINRIIEMAWEDRTPFDAIKNQFGLDESAVIKLMRRNISEHAFKRWRRRVGGRATKHVMKRIDDVTRFKCSQQRAITSNKISKRQ